MLDKAIQLRSNSLGWPQVVARNRLNSNNSNKRRCKMLHDHDYNAARKTLVDAGSKTAHKSHDKHTQGKGSPEEHGKELLRESRDEFRESDKDLPAEDKKSEMAPHHHEAIHRAAEQMGIPEW
jgi:hypothetical protein